jgi:hypothetical protein
MGQQTTQGGLMSSLLEAKDFGYSRISMGRGGRQL